ncbi:MAG: cytochrome c [Anaerolineae bacterium]|nr:cytochrome c [Anaerolineae bacterium]
MNVRLLTLLLLLLVSGCAAGEEATPAPDTTIPVVDSDSSAPPTPDAALVSLGEEVYTRACASCHGDNLEGEADWKEPNPDNSLRAPPHDATGHTWHHSDRVLREAILQGGERLGAFGTSNMPAFAETLSEREVDAVLAYIKSTWPEEIRNMQVGITLSDPGP